MIKTICLNNYLSRLLLCGCLFVSSCNTQSKLHTLNITDAEDMREYFEYKNDGTIRISGHRGGMALGIPENSILSMHKTLEVTQAMFEIDPRLTKDSVIVLMHDGTLDRTTTGTGKLSDYTWSELQKLRLKDRWGNITDEKIPTLEEVIVWARGKTILNLDHKDVPLEMISDLLKRLDACHVMVTVHSPSEALFYHKRNPETMFSAFIRNLDEFHGYDQAGILWENYIAYVGRMFSEEHKEVYRLLHDRGVCCMISLAPTADKITDIEERNKAYRNAILMTPDIIETDFPQELVKEKHKK